MTWRKKTWLVVSLALTVLFSLLYLVLRIILLNSFSDLEDHDVRRNMERVLNAVAAETSNLGATTQDWAAWDDTYAFVSDRNQEYIESNLIDETFANLQLSLMLFVDTSGQIVFGKAYDLENEVAVPLMPGLEEHITELQHLADAADGPVGGFARLPQGTMLVAASPILTSLKEGPSRGTVIFARKLDATWVQQLADSVRLELSIQEVDVPQSVPAPELLSPSAPDLPSIVVRTLSENVVAGDTVVNDVCGEPALSIQMSMPRDVYQRGQTTLKYFGVILAGIGLLFGFVALALLERNVLTKERFQVVFDHSADAICLARQDGTIEHTNPAFNRMFGPLLGNGTRPILGKQIGAEPDDRLAAIFNTVSENKKHGRVQIVAHSKLGQAFEADITLSPVVGSNDRTSGIVCSVRDVSRQKQMEHQLRRALEREMELGEMRAQFVSIASHELRTPLAEIRLANSSLSTYADRMTDEQKQKRLRTIEAAIQRMTKLLEDVLTLSRVESDRFQFKPTRLDIGSFCQDLLHTIAATNGPEHKTSFKTSGDLQQMCLDDRLLHHILDNLLSNAFKYSPPGSTVYFEVAGEDDQITFTIRDEGMGISEQEQEKLFDMFFRGKGVGRISGTGLGLAIAKQAVEVHGGSIAVESTEGKGSTFVVVLPYVCDE